MRLLALVLSACLLTLSLACGSNAPLGTTREMALTPAASGLKSGYFEVVRFNAAGARDSALNQTLALACDERATETWVRIAIEDAQPSAGVCLELKYDTKQLTPVAVVFLGLIETPLELAVLDQVVSLGQVSIAGPGCVSGGFAEVVFKHQPFVPLRTASGDNVYRLINQPYAPLDSGVNVPGFSLLDDSTADGTPASIEVVGLFKVGDGDDNGETNIADMVPMGKYFNEKTSSTLLNPGQADYDGNGEVNISDVAQLGKYFSQLWDGINIYLSDQPDAFGTEPFATLDFAGGKPATSGSTQPTADYHEVWRTWTLSLSQDAIQAFDADFDGRLYVTAAAVVDGQAREYFDATEYAIRLLPPEVETGIIVDKLHLAINGTEYGDGGVWSPKANSQAELMITGIDGSYDSDDDGILDIAFDSSSYLDRGVPASNYEATLSSIQHRVDWQAVARGAAGLRRTMGVVNLSDNRGSPVTGMVFPDDDPQSIPPEAEGELRVEVRAVMSRYVLSDLRLTVVIDVYADPAVPRITGLETDAGQADDGDKLVLAAGGTRMVANFRFGTVDLSANPTQVGCELWNNSNQLAPLEMHYTLNPPVLKQGEFYIHPYVGKPGEYQLEALLPEATEGYSFSPRLRVGVEPEQWSSVNYPEAALLVAGQAEQVEFVVAPPVQFFNRDYKTLTILYPDPLLRRDPQVIYGLDGGIDIVDEVGYSDIVKLADSGLLASEFPIGSNKERFFPQLRMSQLVDGMTVDDITPLTSSQEYIVVHRSPAKLVVDIKAIAFGNDTEEEHWGLRVFGVGTGFDWPPIGSATFSVIQGIPQDYAVSGYDFGINVFDSNESNRGDILRLADADYNTKTLRASQVNDATPDMLFVEFAGGFFGGSCSLMDPLSFENVYLRFSRLGGGNNYDLPVDLRAAAGLGATGNMLAVVTIAQGDFKLLPGDLGFEANTSYELTLVSRGGLTYKFADHLFIQGQPPIGP